MENRKSIPINKHFTLEDGQKVKVEELILTPVSTRLNYKMENVTNDLHFKIEVPKWDGIARILGTNMGYNNYNRFVALEKHVTKLKVIPYIYSDDAGGDRNEKVLYDDIFEIDVK